MIRPALLDQRRSAEQTNSQGVLWERVVAPRGDLPLSFEGARTTEVLTKNRAIDGPAGFADRHALRPAEERSVSVSFQCSGVPSGRTFDLQRFIFAVCQRRPC